MRSPILWTIPSPNPVITPGQLNPPYDTHRAGAAHVLQLGNRYRMYYSAIAEYFPKPDGVRTGHGDVIPSIGIGYAVSRDGLTWEKPLDHRVIEPRGFNTEPYEYIASKPCILREGGGYRAWIHTFGIAYRVRSLTSADGLTWEWFPGGIDGELGVGEDGAFDSFLAMSEKSSPSESRLSTLAACSCVSTTISYRCIRSCV